MYEWFYVVHVDGVVVFDAATYDECVSFIEDHPDEVDFLTIQSVLEYT